MNLTHLESAKIMIIDDEPSNVRLLERILRQEGFYAITALSDPCDTYAMVEQIQPDLILLDLHMPNCDGFMILGQLKPLLDPAMPIPIIVLTADPIAHVRWRALGLGAKDFLTKPFDIIEVLLRIRNLLETRALQLRLQQQNAHLEGQVRERTEYLEEAQRELLERLAWTAEYRDDNTGLHTQRVGTIAKRIAQKLGLAAEEADLIGQAAPLHDLGKIGIPDQILLKPSSLTAQEMALVKHHTTIGAKILTDSQFPVLRIAREIAYSHHERWDGNGYPCGLKGEAVPLCGRIVAVADALDVATHDRPYKPAISLEMAVAELNRLAGKQFDPQVVAACVALLIEDGLLDKHYYAKAYSDSLVRRRYLQPEKDLSAFAANSLARV